MSSRSMVGCRLLRVTACGVTARSAELVLYSVRLHAVPNANEKLKNTSVRWLAMMLSRVASTCQISFRI